MTPIRIRVRLGGGKPAIFEISRDPDGELKIRNAKASGEGMIRDYFAREGNLEVELER